MCFGLLKIVVLQVYFLAMIDVELIFFFGMGDSFMISEYIINYLVLCLPVIKAHFKI